MHREIRSAVLLALSAALLSITGCHPKQAALPSTIPSPPEIELSGRDQGFPPRPAGRTEVVDVPYSEFRGALTVSREAQLRQAATQDARVRAALGERFGYIAANRAELDKEHRDLAAEALSFHADLLQLQQQCRGGSPDEAGHGRGSVAARRLPAT